MVDSSILSQTARDLIRKNYLPYDFSKALSTATIWNASVHNFGKEEYREWFCPQCGLGPIYAPKEWMKMHSKTHFKPDTKKENEMQITEMHPYKIS